MDYKLLNVLIRKADFVKQTAVTIILVQYSYDWNCGFVWIISKRDLKKEMKLLCI